MAHRRVNSPRRRRKRFDRMVVVRAATRLARGGWRPQRLGLMSARDVDWNEGSLTTEFGLEGRLVRTRAELNGAVRGGSGSRLKVWGSDSVVAESSAARSGSEAGE